MTATPMTENNWLAMNGAGAVMGAIGAFAGAVGQRQQLNMQAEVAAINAAMAENNAQFELMRGQKAEQGVRLKTAQFKSAQRAGFAGRGVDLGVGSAARTLAATDIMGEIDANQVAANAVRSAWGQRMQATNYSNQAAMSRSAASAVNPALSAATSLMGSAARVSTSWYALSQAGAFAKPAVDNIDSGDGMSNWAF